jgi:hypothetical protein
MKGLKAFALILFCCARLAIAGDYVPGSGSTFKMTFNKGAEAQLSIYITESSFTRLGVEYYFSAGDFLKTELWQQFHLALSGARPSEGHALTLEDGLILSDEMKRPEVMSKDFLNSKNDGVNLEDFFFKKGADLEKLKVGVEKIEVPAGSLLATHYRRVNNGQTVDFWISDKAGAIGLVKLVSVGKTDPQNYRIELLSLLKNVKPKIDPREAVPLTEKGKAFLNPK